MTLILIPGPQRAGTEHLKWEMSDGGLTITVLPPCVSAATHLNQPSM